jgi:hypothetical protein
MWPVVRHSTDPVPANLAPPAAILPSWPAYNRTDRAVCRALYPAATRRRPTAGGDGGSRPHEESMVTKQGSLDLERLLKLRLVVARIGEMDRAGWWNTKGQLGPLGAIALKRGLPRTHHFAQARSVFAVAAHRCDEVFNPPGSWTLWRLPREVEEAFDARWEHWVDAAADWAPVFGQVAELKGTDLTAALQELGLAGADDLAALSRLRTTAEGRAVPLPAPFAGTNEDITLLALGFALGRPGALAVPYARVED